MFVQNFISSRDGPEKGTETRQRWKPQEDYATSTVYFLHSFISALFVFFFQAYPYLK